MFRWIVFFMAFALILGGCTPQNETPKPPEIAYGQDVCGRCGMVIDTPRYASAVYLHDKSYMLFDDLGEMLLHYTRNADSKVAAWFVHDYHTEEWLDGQTAVYVKSSKLATPMGMGIAAFASREQAQQFAMEMDGVVYEFKDVRSAFQGAVKMQMGGASH